MMKFNVTAKHVDTCLPDYLTDSYSRDGQTLLCCTPRGQSIEDATEELFESIDGDGDMPGSITEEQVQTALHAALKGVDLRYIDEKGNRCETPPEEFDGDELPYVYVVLEWEFDPDSITNEQFDGILEELVSDMTTSDILAVPGVYEILKEELNNEVLKAAEEQARRG